MQHINVVVRSQTLRECDWSQYYFYIFIVVSPRIALLDSRNFS
jgi:hypothetical protein